MKRLLTITLALTMLVTFAGQHALADGTETLGPPAIDIQPGTGIAVAGVGLAEGQPGTIFIDIPNDAAVIQVILYWAGFYDVDPGIVDTMTISVEGNTVQGDLIGGPTPFNVNDYAAAYRADITSLDLIGSGPNAIDVDGLAFTAVNHGAGLIVIYDDASDPADIQLRDGVDSAFINFAPPQDTTVPQTFTFDPADSDRTATLALFAASIEGQDLPGQRPTIIQVNVDGQPPLYFDNLLASSDGLEWDTVLLDIDIPADAASLTVQVLSADADDTGNLPASLVWLTGTLAITPPSTEILACRVTGGGNDSYIDDPNSDSLTPRQLRRLANHYRFGGQAGAPTASQPQPYGQWTHHQQRGPDGSFVFHAGTASAPEGTEIDWIACSDPGWCSPARHAPAKQIDFAGVGTFRNIRRPGPSLANVVARQTYHWFEVHIEDLGEPGKGKAKAKAKGKAKGLHSRPAANDALCPPQGSAGQNANCDCPDFYSITIYEAFNPDTDAVNNTDVIYQVHGYINGGNLQIHPAIK